MVHYNLLFNDISDVRLFMINEGSDEEPKE